MVAVALAALAIYADSDLAMLLAFAVALTIDPILLGLLARAGMR